MQKITIACALLLLVAVSGSAFAATWTPAGGGVQSSVPPDTYTGCTVNTTWRDGQTHEKKWKIKTTDPEGLIVLNDDELTEEARQELLEAKLQKDDDNVVIIGANNSVTGVDSSPN